MTEIPTESGQKLYLATVIDLYSRRLLGAAMGLHPDAELACAQRSRWRCRTWRPPRDLADEESERVIFHTTAGALIRRTRSPRCAARWVSASRWVGSDRVSDNAATEAFFSSLEWEVLPRNRLRDTVPAQAKAIVGLCVWVLQRWVGECLPAGWAAVAQLGC